MIDKKNIEIRPVSNDSIVLTYCYAIRVQHAILQHVMNEKIVKLTATGRFNQVSVKSLVNKIESVPILTSGNLSIADMSRENEVFRLSEMRERLIKIGMVSVESGKLVCTEKAVINPSQLFNCQYLTETSDIFEKCADLFSHFNFQPSNEFFKLVASGVSVEKALHSVSCHVKTHAQQKSTYDLIIKPQVMFPLEWIGLVARHPVRTTPLWDEVVFTV